MSEFTWGDAAATVSALSALLLLLSTIAIYWRTSRGKAVVAWNLREPGSPVIDVYVKNIGGTPMYGLKVNVPRLEKLITLPVLPPHGQVTVDMLTHHDSEQRYSVVSDSLGPEPEKEEASVTIDPQQLTGIKLGSRLPISRIAAILEQIQKKLEDPPIFRDVIERVEISRPGEETWRLPKEVRGVLLPSPTWRKGTHEDTEYGDSWAQHKLSNEVVHQPLQVLRIVVDGAVSEEDHERIRKYLRAGSTIVLHWYYSRGHVQRLSYYIQSESMLPKEAVILERSVKFIQEGSEMHSAEEGDQREED